MFRRRRTFRFEVEALTEAEARTEATEMAGASLEPDALTIRPHPTVEDIWCVTVTTSDRYVIDTMDDVFDHDVD